MALDDDQCAALIGGQFGRQGIECSAGCPSHGLVLTGDGTKPPLTFGDWLRYDGDFHSVTLTS
jgi:hypothetical protein